MRGRPRGDYQYCRSEPEKTNFRKKKVSRPPQAVFFPFGYNRSMESTTQFPAVAVVTGASSGIGASFARRLAAHFAGRERYPGLPRIDELIVVARRGDRLEALKEELSAVKDDAGNALAVRPLVLDLAVPGSTARLAREVEGAEKPLGILVNNAGYGTYGPFSDVDIGKQLGQIDLNCRSLTESCGLLGPFLGRGSVVVNVASLAACAPLGNFAVYAASKAYVLSFSVALSAEWEERGIKICALCPGSVSSEFALVASGGARKEVLHGWSAEATTARCLRDAGQGKAISMPRLLWRLKRLAGTIAGPVLSARFSWRTMKRPHA